MLVTQANKREACFGFLLSFFDCKGNHFSLQVLSVHVEEQMFDDYYNGCCNATFWPLFHSMPDRAVFQADKWEVRDLITIKVEPFRIRLRLESKDSLVLLLGEPLAARWISIMQCNGMRHYTG